MMRRLFSALSFFGFNLTALLFFAGIGIATSAQYGVLGLPQSVNGWLAFPGNIVATWRPDLIPHALTTQDLQSRSVLFIPTGTTIWQDGTWTVGDAPPVRRYLTGASCKLNNGNGDNGAEVSALGGGNCWRITSQSSWDPAWWPTHHDVVLTKSAVTTTANSGMITVPSAQFTSNDCNSGVGCTGPVDKLITITDTIGDKVTPSQPSYQGKITQVASATSVLVSPAVSFSVPDARDVLRPVKNQRVAYASDDCGALNAMTAFLSTLTTQAEGGATQIDINHGGRLYGLGCPYQHSAGGTYRNGNLVALSSDPARGWSCATGLAYVTANTFSTEEYMTFDSNYLNVNSYLELPNAVTRVVHSRGFGWAGTCASYYATGSPTAGSYIVPVSDASNLLTLLFARGNASLPDRAKIVDVEAYPGGSINSITSSTTDPSSGATSTTNLFATATVSSTSGMVGNRQVVISGDSQAAYNGMFNVWYVIDGTHFAYKLPGSAGTTSLGTGTGGTVNNYDCPGQQCVIIDRPATATATNVSLRFDRDVNCMTSYGVNPSPANPNANSPTAAAHITESQCNEYNGNDTDHLVGSVAAGSGYGVNGDNYGYYYLLQGTQAEWRGSIGTQSAGGIGMDSGSSALAIDSNSQLDNTNYRTAELNPTAVIMASGAFRLTVDGETGGGIFEEWHLGSTIPQARYNGLVFSAPAAAITTSPNNLIQVMTNQMNMNVTRLRTSGDANFGGFINHLSLGGIGTCGVNYSYMGLTCGQIAKMATLSSVDFPAYTFATPGMNLIGGDLTSTNLLLGGGAPTVFFGFGTGGLIAASNGSGSFKVTVGSSPGTTHSIQFATAAMNGYTCHASDTTTPSISVKQIDGGSTTIARFQTQNSSGAATAPTAGDNINFICTAD